MSSRISSGISIGADSSSNFSASLYLNASTSKGSYSSSAPDTSEELFLPYALNFSFLSFSWIFNAAAKFLSTMVSLFSHRFSSFKMTSSLAFLNLFFYSLLMRTSSILIYMANWIHFNNLPSVTEYSSTFSSSISSRFCFRNESF